MKIEDLNVGMEVLMVKADFVTNNFDTINGGYIDRNTHLFLSDDMYSTLIGKRVTIEEVDPNDPKLNVKACGFYIPSSWILKKAPKLRPRKKSTTTVSDTANDGTKYGPIFKKMLEKYPQLGNLSTNRLSRLTEPELRAICELTNIPYDTSNLRELYEKIASAFL